MDESITAIGSKIVECCPGTQRPIWAISNDGKLRLFLSPHTPVGHVLRLRRWLLEKGFMGADGGFVIKQDDEMAFLIAHLDVEKMS